MTQGIKQKRSLFVVKEVDEVMDVDVSASQLNENDTENREPQILGGGGGGRRRRQQQRQQQRGKGGGRTSRHAAKPDQIPLQIVQPSTSPNSNYTHSLSHSPPALAPSPLPQQPAAGLDPLTSSFLGLGITTRPLGAGVGVGSGGPNPHPLLLATPLLVFFAALSALLGVWAIYTLSQRRKLSGYGSRAWSDSKNYSYEDGDEAGIRMMYGDRSKVEDGQREGGEREEEAYEDAIEKSGEMIEEEVRLLVLGEQESMPYQSQAWSPYMNSYDTYNTYPDSPGSSSSSSSSGSSSASSSSSSSRNHQRQHNSRREGSLWDYYAGVTGTDGNSNSIAMGGIVGGMPVVPYYLREDDYEREGEEDEEAPSPTRSLKGKERAFE